MFGVLSWILIQIDRDRNHRGRERGERGGEGSCEGEDPIFPFRVEFSYSFLCVTLRERERAKKKKR